MKRIKSARKRISSGCCFAVLFCISALFGQTAISAVISTNLPTSVSGGSGAVADIQTNDAVAYAANKMNTIAVGGFSAIGGAISSVVLYVEFSVDSGGYSGTGAIQVNGADTTIVPADGDTDRAASVDLMGTFGIDTWAEIQSLSMDFVNDDGGSGQAVNFDYVYLVINHEDWPFPATVDSETPVGSLPVSGGTGWSLVFSDEFNVTNLDTSKWGIDVSTSSRNPRTTHGIDDWWWKAENVSLDGSNLVLSVTKQDANTMWCGSVSSDGLYEPKYGYLEARIEIADTTKDTHTAFWLQGPNMNNTDPADGTAYDGAEVDIFESAWFGDYTKSVVHIDGYDADHRANTRQYSTPGIHNGYHVFGLYWTEESMKIYYDGVLKVTYTGTWVPRTNEWIWLSDGASFGDIGTFTSEPTGWLTAAKFDYVRVWEAPTNFAPEFTTDPISRADATAGTAYSDSIAGSATDSDADILSYTKDSGPEWLTIASNGNLSGTPSRADGGTNSWSVAVTDGNGGSATGTLNIVVMSEPTYIILSTNSLSVSEGGTSALDVRLQPLPENTVTVNVSRVSGDTDVTVSAGSELIFTPANGTNWQQVTIAAAEDGDTLNDSATFLVEDVAGTYTNDTFDVVEVENDFDVPAVSNYYATPISSTSADLSGWVVSGAVVQAWVCWGTADGGSLSTSEWQNVVFSGTVTEDTNFTVNITGLATNATYWYRCYVTNISGAAWSDAATFSGTLFHELPFSEDFEGLSNGVWNSQNLWSASNAVVQSSLKFDTQAGSITSETGFARQEFASTNTDVWTDMKIQPLFCPDDMTPPFSDATASMYFNTNGNPVAFDGTNRVTYAGTVVTTGNWIRVTIHSDYTAKTWDLYIDDAHIGTNLGFYSESVVKYEMLDVRGGAADVMAIDDISVNTLSPFGATFWLTVNSLYGTPSPSGSAAYLSDTPVNAIMTTPTVHAGGTTQYVCTGWSRAGSESGVGSTTNTSFTITNDTTVTWQWSTNYWILLNTIGE